MGRARIRRRIAGDHGVVGGIRSGVQHGRIAPRRVMMHAGRRTHARLVVTVDLDDAAREKQAGEQAARPHHDASQNAS